ncbi:MAG: putative selenium-dependent hydroxylase accessory protein YqeC [Proteobacteria bacterium]|nr:putative selenium-dependent hydroxylase accessory protein YqeC [Pseudomonadota bacterium]MBU1452009.1 putative selenium-dependent hydroxylase accessory protein YqeC [Pseudomonadota bacterium]MBU2470514.1 putative selenium-dependent hydroxylase accessory protein YqeC [Pseudomonadota bacterium]MBU2516015.1 putative selenium-dependent hydroxylase accessory protein YqeC [Pseudomonadota bacterium]
MALPKSEVAGIILAAGLSTRFGGEKLTTPLAGRPLAFWAIEAALTSRLGRVVLVTRPELAGELAATFPGLELVLNHQAHQGQASSLRLGLEALGPGHSHALFLLADQPLLTSDLINSFVDKAESGIGLAALAGSESFSPPTLFARGFWKDLGQAQGDSGGREILRAHAGEAAFLTPNFPLAGLDVDTPEQLGRAEAVLCQRFSRALELEHGDMVSLVGAGGKTSLLETLASEQASAGQAVLATTTTHIFRPSGQVLLEPHEQWLPERIARRLAPGWCLTVAAGATSGEDRPKLKGLTPQSVDWLWEEGVAPLILVEADGARRLPLKAPRTHEPVTPLATTVLVGVLGLSAMGQPVDDEHVLAVPEFCALTGAAPGEAVTPAHLAALAAHPKGLFKKAPPRARKALVLNQGELPGAAEAARQVAEMVSEQEPALRVLLTSLQRGECEVLLEGD